VSLSDRYWAEALNTATHLLNRLPSKAASHPTPHFALYGTPPSYSHLRVFGCVCYPNTSATAPHKLSPRSTRYFFLGYSLDHKGYQCLDLLTHRIISRHVVFDEEVFPLTGYSPATDLDCPLEFELFLLHLGRLSRLRSRLYMRHARLRCFRSRLYPRHAWPQRLRSRLYLRHVRGSFDLARTMCVVVDPSSAACAKHDPIDECGPDACPPSRSLDRTHPHLPPLRTGPSNVSR
jgi:hypothetical protein